MERKAVVCDDDRSMARIVEHILKKLGFSVFQGRNGAEGLSLVREHRPTLLTLDLEMPVMDGVAVLRELRKEAAAPPYVIVLSAEESAEVRRLGEYDFVIKPFTPTDFLKKIEDLIGKGKL